MIYLIDKVLEHRRRLDQSEQAECLEVCEEVSIVEWLDDVQRAADTEDRLKLVDATTEIGSNTVAGHLYTAFQVEEQREAALQNRRDMVGLR